MYSSSVETILSGSGSYDPITIEHRDESKSDIKYRYTPSELDCTKEILQEAMEKKQHRSNECWIDTLLEVSGNRLTRGKQQQL